MGINNHKKRTDAAGRERPYSGHGPPDCREAQLPGQPVRRLRPERGGPAPAGPRPAGWERALARLPAPSIEDIVLLPSVPSASPARNRSFAQSSQIFLDAASASPIKVIAAASR